MVITSTGGFLNSRSKDITLLSSKYYIYPQPQSNSRAQWSARWIDGKGMLWSLVLFTSSGDLGSGKVRSPCSFTSLNSLCNAYLWKKYSCFFHSCNKGHFSSLFLPWCCLVRLWRKLELTLWRPKFWYASLFRWGWLKGIDGSSITRNGRCYWVHGLAT